MNDDWPHPRELPQETLMLARIKTLLGLAMAITLMLFALVFLSLDEPFLSALTFALGALLSVIVLGRSDPGWRAVAEMVPGIEYEFPPIETIEATDDPWERDPDE